MLFQSSRSQIFLTALSESIESKTKNKTEKQLQKKNINHNETWRAAFC